MASVTKRRWKKPDGSTGEAWMVRYLDPSTGKRPGKSFDLKKDADAFKRKVEREIEDGTHVARADTKTMRDVMDEFIAHMELRWNEGRIGEGHYRRQVMVVNAYLTPALAARVVRDLTMQDVAKLHRSMADRGLHPRSIKQYLSTLTLIEKFARKRGYLKTQPVADAMSDLRGAPRYRVETFKPEEITQLLYAAPANMKGRPLRTACFMGCAVALAALAGLRAGEILGLHTSNVDLDARTIRVRHSMTTYGELKGPKTAAGVRNVRIPEALAALLRHWIDNHHSGAVDGLFFTTSTGNRYVYYALNMGWVRLLQRENMPHRHFHALRHFYTSWLLRHGMPVAEVSKMLGHSDQRVTLEVYTHALMEDDEAGVRVDRIAGLLARADTSVTHGAENPQ